MAPPANNSFEARGVNVAAAPLSGVERLLVAVEAARIGAWEWHAETGEVQLCPRAAEIVGLAPLAADEGSAYAADALLTLLHPDDALAAQAALLAALHDCEGRFSLRCHLRRAVDGEERAVQVDGRVLAEEPGAPERVLGAVVDVTADARRERERERLLDDALAARLAAQRATSELESVLARLHDAVYVLDREGRVTYANDAGIAGAGRPREQLPGAVLWDLLPDGGDGALQRELEALLATGESRSFELHHASADGATLVRAYPAADGLVVFATDVSAERRAVRALEEREEHLRLALSTARLVRWEWDLREGVVRRDVPGAALLAIGPAQTLEQFLGLVHPDDRSTWLAAFRAAADTGVDFAVDYRMVGGDGQTRWVVSRGRASRHDAAGRPLALSGISIDGTPLWRAESELRTAQHRLDALSSANVIGVAMGAGDRIQAANDLYLGLVGRSRADLEAGALTVTGVTAPEHAPLDRERWGELLAAGTTAPYEKDYVRPDGTRVPAMVGAALLDREREEWMAFALDLSERRRAEERLAGLQRLTAALARALTRRQIARAALEAGVDALGAVAGAFTALDHSREALEVVHSFGWKAGAPARGLRVPLARGTAGAAAIEAGEPVVYCTLDEVQSAAAGLAEVVDVAGAGALVALPLQVANRMLGVLLLAFAEERGFEAADRDFLGSIGELSAQALLRSIRYEAEHEVAVTLQRSIIPAVLPQLDGIDLEAAYLPAGESSGVGGDWYDVFPLGAEIVVLAIGDVAGKGVLAAAAMAQFRNALRAYAVDGFGPSSVLERLDRLSVLMPDAPFATVQIAYLARSSGEVLYASAGHPPAALRSANGTVMFVEGGRGTPIGAGARARYDEAELRLVKGDSLVLYTDGLVEQRDQPLDDGLERLACALHLAPAGAGAVVPHLLRQLVVSGRAEDDIAILAARRTA